MSGDTTISSAIKIALDLLEDIKAVNAPLYQTMRPILPGFTKALAASGENIDAKILQSHIDEGADHIKTTRKRLDQNKRQKPKTYHDIKNDIYDKTIENLLGGEALSLAIRANDLSAAQEIISTHDDINHHCDILQHCLKDCSVEMFALIVNKYPAEEWAGRRVTTQIRHDEDIFNAAIKLDNPALFNFVYEHFDTHIHPIKDLFFQSLNDGLTALCINILTLHGHEILPLYADYITLYAAARDYDDMLNYFEENDIISKFEPNHKGLELKKAPLAIVLRHGNINAYTFQHKTAEDCEAALYLVAFEHSIKTNDIAAIDDLLPKYTPQFSSNYAGYGLRNMLQDAVAHLDIDTLHTLIQFYQLDISGGNNDIFSFDSKTENPDLEFIAKHIGETGDIEKIEWFLNPDNFSYLEQRLNHAAWSNLFIIPMAKSCIKHTQIDAFKALDIKKKSQLEECLIFACAHNQTEIISLILDKKPSLLKSPPSLQAALKGDNCIELFLTRYKYEEKAIDRFLDYALNYGSPSNCKYLAQNLENINEVSTGTIMDLCTQSENTDSESEKEQLKYASQKLHSLIENGLLIENLPESYRSQYKKYAEWMNMHGDTIEDIPLHLTEYSPHYFKPKTYEFVKNLFGYERGFNEQTAKEITAYQISTLFQTKDRILNYLEKWGKTGHTLHDISQMISVPKQGQFNAKSWGDAVLKHGPRMANLIRFADRLAEPLKNNAGTTWSYKNTLDAIGGDLYSRAKEHTKLAELCANILYSEADFEKALEFWALYQEQYKGSDYQKTQHSIPSIEIDGGEFEKPDYIFRKLDDGDVRGLLLGAFTECCQHVANPHGHSCAEHGFMNETSGFYVIENKQTSAIIAQSWAWRGKENELTLDSLEFVNGTFNANNWQKLCSVFAQEIAKRDELRDIPAIHIGCGGKTPALNFEYAAKDQMAELQESCAYSDARESQYKVDIPRNAL
tara:strand:- start:36967 stop:39855 length:2889 start_codon:yes stop_codon:yes gene_type:complete